MSFSERGANCHRQFRRVEVDGILRCLNLPGFLVELRLHFRRAGEALRLLVELSGVQRDQLHLVVLCNDVDAVSTAAVALRLEITAWRKEEEEVRGRGMRGGG